MAKKKSLWQQIKDAFKSAMSGGSKSQSLAKQSGNTSPSINKNVSSAYEKALKKKVFDDAQENKRKEVHRLNDNGGIKQTEKKIISTAMENANKDADAIKANRAKAEQRRKELIALKNSDQKALVKNIEDSNKAHPYLSQAIQGAANGLSFGLMDKAVEKTARPEVKKALKAVDKNLTKGQKVARTVGEIGGSFVPFGVTAKGAAKVGEAVAKEGTVLGEGLSKLANSNVVKSIAKKAKVDEAELSAKVLKGLQADLGMNLTTGNVMSIINAAETEGDLSDKLKNYIANQAINMGIGGAIELAPAAKFGAKAIANTPEAQRLYRSTLGNKQGAIRLGRDSGTPLNLKSFDGYELDQNARGKLETAVKEIQSHIDNGDIDKAINVTRLASDDISRSAKMAVDDGNDLIRNEIRSQKISIPKGNKSDLNYVENFRKANFGKLNVGNDGTPIDEVWQVLNSRYGNMFPAEVTDPVEQMNWLSDFMTSRKSETIPDDYARDLSNNLSRELWAKLSKSDVPMEEAYEKAMTPRGEWVSDEINAELLPNGEMDAAIRKQYEDEVAEQYNNEINKVRQDIIDEVNNERLTAEINTLENYKKALTDRLNKEEISNEERYRLLEDIDRADRMISDYKKSIKARVVNETNPMDESLGEHTWIKNAEDVKTFDEVHPTSEDITPDFTAEMVDEAKRTGEIKVYSSSPIENGTFVTPSKMEAQNYAGNGEVYEAIVKTDDVAWIDEIEGQLARTDDGLVRTDDGLVIDPATGEVLEDNRIMPEVKTEKPTPISKDMQEAKAMLDEANGFNSIDEPIPGIEEKIMPQPKSKKSPKLKRVAGNYEELQKAANRAEDRTFAEGKSVGQGEYEITEAGDRNIRATSEDVIEEARRETDATYGKGATNTDDTATSKSYITALKNATTDDAERIVQQMKDEGRFDYNLMHHASLKNRIEKFAKSPQEFETFLNRVKDANASPTGRGIFGYKEVKEAQYDAYAALSFFTDKAKTDNKYGDVCEELFTFIKDNASQGGTVLELQRHMAMMRPDSRIKLATDDLAKMLDRNIGFRKEHPELSADKKERLAQIAEIIKKDSGLKEKAKKLSTKDLSAKESSEAYTEFINEGTKLMPMTVIDYVQEWRYLSMLGNAKTHLRNRFGNAFFGGIREVSNSFAAAVERYVYRNDKSHTFQYAGFSADAIKEAYAKKPTTELGNLGLKAWNESKSELIKVSDKFDLRDSKGRPRKGVTKFIGKLNELNSKWLEHADESAMSKRFREQFYKIAKKNGLDKLEPNSKEYKTLYSQCIRNASEEALVATHRQANDLAKALNNITRNLTDANASAKQRAGAAVLNTVVPFVKTPANILSKSIKYTPEGIIEGFIKVMKAGKTGNVEAVNEAIGMIGEGLTGSGVLALGAFAGMNSDAFTTNAGDEADAKFKKRQGVQNYSVTIGNHSFTLDWLSPIASTFFMGVALGKEALNSREMGTAFTLNNLEMVAKEAIEPILETSMLSGLNDVFEAASNNYGENSKKGVPSKVGEVIVYNFLSSMIPTLQGQVARTAYKSDKKLDSDRYYESMLESKSGLGVLTLGAQTDSWGKKRGEKKDVIDYIKAGAINMLSPANIQRVDLGKEDKELLKQYKTLIDGGMDKEEAADIFPKPNSYKEFQFGKKEIGKTKVEMTNKELSLYNQARDKGGGKDAMDALMRTKMFNKYGNGGLSAEQKLSLVKEAPKSTKEVFAWMMKQPQYKNASDEEKKQAYQYMFNTATSGGSIGNRKSGERAVWEAQGNDPVDYEFANDLSAKQQSKYEQYKDIVSKEQVLDFIKYGNGKKQYQYEDGSLRGYFTKAQMNSYFAKHPELSEKEKEALYNMFTTGKPYGTSGGGRGGYGRRRSSSKGTGKVVNYGNAGAYKRSKGYKSLSSGNGTSKPKPPIKAGTRVTKDMLPEIKK